MRMYIWPGRMLCTEGGIYPIVSWGALCIIWMLMMIGQNVSKCLNAFVLVLVDDVTGRNTRRRFLKNSFDLVWHSCENHQQLIHFYVTTMQWRRVRPSGENLILELSHAAINLMIRLLLPLSRSMLTENPMNNCRHHGMNATPSSRISNILMGLQA